MSTSPLRLGPTPAPGLAISSSPTPGAPAGTGPARPVAWPVIIGVLLVRTALLFAANGVFTLVTGDYGQGLLWANVTIVAVDVICIGLIAHLARRQGRTLRDLVQFRLRDTGWAALLCLIVSIGFFACSFIGNLVAYQGPPPAPTATFTPPLWLGLWSLLVLPITVAVAEELLYRGWAQPELARRTNQLAGLVIMAFFFGLQHAALTPLDAQAQLARFVTTFLAGLMFGALYLWRKRLWPLIVAHWFVDVVGLGLPALLAALS
ncbi:CPBP family intramembrane glutamic endopeptidase [Granulicoccus sp. GXG6511]|uniref:CPBP family intramembrane glutamic endopeptidase n=1 Tax=Granulicoccus sp. GXG6511 TaxID=3381351 RepID=UPI003D7E2843